MVGTWEAVLEMNGEEIGRNLFTGDERLGPPEIRLLEGSVPNSLKAYRTTPIEFGTVGRGSTPSQKTFTIINHGYSSAYAEQLGIA